MPWLRADELAGITPKPFKGKACLSRDAIVEASLLSHDWLSCASCVVHISAALQPYNRGLNTWQRLWCFCEPLDDRSACTARVVTVESC